MKSLWLLIRDCMREIENRNNIKFGDRAWQDFKGLEDDIYKLFRDENLVCARCGTAIRTVTPCESEATE